MLLLANLNRIGHYKPSLQVYKPNIMIKNLLEKITICYLYLPSGLLDVIVFCLEGVIFLFQLHLYVNVIQKRHT